MLSFLVDFVGTGKFHPEIAGIPGSGGIGNPVRWRIDFLGRSLASDDVRVFIGGVKAIVLQIRSDAPDGIEQIDVQASSEGLEGVTFADVVVLRNGVLSAPEGIVLGSVSRQQPQ